MISFSDFLATIFQLFAQDILFVFFSAVKSYKSRFREISSLLNVDYIFNWKFEEDVGSQTYSSVRKSNSEFLVFCSNTLWNISKHRNCTVSGRRALKYPVLTIFVILRKTDRCSFEKWFKLSNVKELRWNDVKMMIQITQMADIYSKKSDKLG